MSFADLPVGEASPRPPSPASVAHVAVEPELEPAPAPARPLPGPAPDGGLAWPEVRRPAVFPLRERAPLSSLWRAARRAVVASGKLVLVGLLTYGLMFNFSVVRGSSMSPSIHDGDRILVDQLTFLIQGVQRGDIVVLQYPLDTSVDYIKRVIGLPGDVVRIEEGRVFVNDVPLEEPYVAHPASGTHVVRVRPQHYFVLGDNRPHSSDSREFGLVPRELIRGRVDVRVWPFDRAGRID